MNPTRIAMLETLPIRRRTLSEPLPCECYACKSTCVYTLSNVVLSFQATPDIFAPSAPNQIPQPHSHHCPRHCAQCTMFPIIPLPDKCQWTPTDRHAHSFQSSSFPPPSSFHLPCHLLPALSISPITFFLVLPHHAA